MPFKYDSSEEITLAQKIIRDLTETALDNNELSGDEVAVLSYLRGKVHDLQRIIDDALADQVLEQQELDQIHQAAEKILKGIIEITKKDGVVTSEESALVETLREIIKDQLKLSL